MGFLSGKFKSRDSGVDKKNGTNGNNEFQTASRGLESLQ